MKQPLMSSHEAGGGKSASSSPRSHRRVYRVEREIEGNVARHRKPEERHGLLPRCIAYQHVSPNVHEPDRILVVNDRFVQGGWSP